MALVFHPRAGLNRTELTANGKMVLEARYLRRDEGGRVVETPEEMFWRVAHDVARAELAYGGPDASVRAAEAFFDLMVRLDFLPNSPTLMNAGRELEQLSACFVLPVEDSIDSIFESVRQAALIHKSGGGTGFSFSRIRPKGDKVRSTHGVSSGPVSFMRVFDAATEAVRQGGMRRGANMGILRVDHPDILEFVEAKSGSGDLSNFNVSVAVTDEFMKAAARGHEYALLHPRTGRPTGHLRADGVLRRVSCQAWECGDPGLIFLDAINRDNPTPALGPLECTNPCGELPLLPFESCNLGSINLANMVRRGSSGRPGIDYERLAYAVRIAVQFLDDVVDVNRYPLPETEAMTRGNRKIGLGVMGWADMLSILGVPYASSRALTLADKVMGFIRGTGHRVSTELVARRGPYPNCAVGGGPQTKRRNATVTGIAPTGTISIIAGCSSGIEPHFALSYARRHVLDGRELQEVHPGLLSELRCRGLTSAAVLDEVRRTGSLGALDLPEDLRDRYQTALEISPEWHVRMQAAFQKHSDNAVSKTVNLPCTATIEDVAAAFHLAHQLGCKGITVYRDRSRETQVLNVGCAACA